MYSNKHKEIYMLYIKPGIENAERMRKAYLNTCSFLSSLKPLHQHKRKARTQLLFIHMPMAH